MALKKILGAVSGDITLTNIEFLKGKKDLKLKVMLKDWWAIRNLRGHEYEFSVEAFREQGYQNTIAIDGCMFSSSGCAITDPKTKYGFELDWIEWVEYEYMEEVDESDDEPKIISAQEYVRMVESRRSAAKKIAITTFEWYLKESKSPALRQHLILEYQYNPKTARMSEPITMGIADMIRDMLKQSGWVIHKSEYYSDRTTRFYELDIEAL